VCASNNNSTATDSHTGRTAHACNSTLPPIQPGIVPKLKGVAQTATPALTTAERQGEEARGLTLCCGYLRDSGTCRPPASMPAPQPHQASIDGTKKPVRNKTREQEGRERWVCGTGSVLQPTPAPSSANLLHTRTLPPTLAGLLNLESATQHYHSTITHTDEGRLRRCRSSRRGARRPGGRGRGNSGGRMNGAPGPGQPTHSFFTPHQHKWMSHLAPAKKHTQDDARGHTSAHGILTLVSSCVQRRLGAELSTSSEDRHTTVYRARRASFGASSSGYRLKWRRQFS
jgi:hypothetical protein